ncbi:hypothetical protein D3C71_2124670 [compost metagenome]
MAVRVVDRLEVVDVKHYQPKRVPLFVRVDRRERLVERTAVGETGEFVGVGDHPQALDLVA